MLVAGGSCINVADNKGMTPRQLAVQSEDHELAAYLESKFTSRFCLFKFLFFVVTIRFESRCINCFTKLVYEGSRASQIRAIKQFFENSDSYGICKKMRL